MRRLCFCTLSTCNWGSSGVESYSRNFTFYVLHEGTKTLKCLVRSFEHMDTVDRVMLIVVLTIIEASFWNIRFDDFSCEHGSSGFALQSLRQHNLKSTFKMISGRNFLVYVKQRQCKTPALQVDNAYTGSRSMVVLAVHEVSCEFNRG